MNQENQISISDACKKLDTSVYIIRHFCDAGYIPHVKRNHKYQRVLNPKQFELLAILVKMKQSAFKKSEIKRYAKLARQYESTEAERLAILTTKKHQIQQEIKGRQAAIDFIERQEELYAVRTTNLNGPTPKESQN